MEKKKLFKDVLVELDNTTITHLLDFYLRMALHNVQSKKKVKLKTIFETLREIDAETQRREGFWVA